MLPSVADIDLVARWCQSFKSFEGAISVLFVVVCKKFSCVGGMEMGMGEEQHEKKQPKRARGRQQEKESKHQSKRKRKAKRMAKRIATDSNKKAKGKQRTMGSQNGQQLPSVFRAKPASYKVRHTRPWS